MGRVLLMSGILVICAAAIASLLAVGWVVATADSAPNLSTLPARHANPPTEIFASDGTLLETWTGGVASFGDLMIAMGRVLVVGKETPGKLYQIDPSQPPDGVTLLASTLGGLPSGIAFDGNSDLWLATGLSILRYSDPTALSGTVVVKCPPR